MASALTLSRFAERRITGFEHHDEDSWTLIYQRSETGSMPCIGPIEEDGSVTYQLDDGPEGALRTR